MKVSKQVRAARKAAQRARLERKKEDDYGSFYANQPLQRAKAKMNAEIRVARSVVRGAAADVAKALVTGENLEDAEARLAAAKQRLTDAKARKDNLRQTLGGVA